MFAVLGRPGGRETSHKATLRFRSTMTSDLTEQLARKLARAHGDNPEAQRFPCWRYYHAWRSKVLASLQEPGPDHIRFAVREAASRASARLSEKPFASAASSPAAVVPR